MDGNVVILTGTIATEIKESITNKGNHCCSFRLRCFGDLNTKHGAFFVTVNAYKALAGHVLEKMKVGDYVFIHGRLRINTVKNKYGSFDYTEVTALEATLLKHADRNRKKNTVMPEFTPSKSQEIIDEEDMSLPSHARSVEFIMRKRSEMEMDVPEFDDIEDNIC